VKILYNGREVATLEDGQLTTDYPQLRTLWANPPPLLVGGEVGGVNFSRQKTAETPGEKEQAFREALRLVGFRFEE
jgi:hypothetical protein